MPLYEFKCPGCGTSFEEIVRSSDTEAVVCPDCGSENPERKMSTFATCSSGSASFNPSSSSGCGGSSGFS